MVPAPAAVPVERLVGMGLVGPRRLRPASGVCARVSSRPVPPTLRLVEGPVLSFVEGRFATTFFAACLSLPARAGFVAFFRAAFPFGVFAPAVRRLRPLLAFAAPALSFVEGPARFADRVFFVALVLPLFFAIGLFSLPVLRDLSRWPGWLTNRP